MYGMVKTTIYLTEALKRRIELTARERATSEADVIRSALDAGVPPLERPRPTVPLFDSGKPIEDWDEAMRGFGED